MQELNPGDKFAVVRVSTQSLIGFKTLEEAENFALRVAGAEAVYIFQLKARIALRAELIRED